MDDPFQTPKPAGNDHINVLEDRELRRWSDKLDVTKAKLKAAVNTVGPSIKAIEAYLKKR
jgi:hypothetical protein